LGLGLGPTRAFAQDPDPESEAAPVQVQQVGLMPIELQGTARGKVKKQLSDALRQGLLRGTVEINTFNDEGVCATGPCREALAGQSVVIIRPTIKVDGSGYAIKLEVFRQGEAKAVAAFDNTCEACDADAAGELLTELAGALLDAIEQLPAEPEPTPAPAEDLQDEEPVEDEPVAEGPQPEASSEPPEESSKPPLKPLWGALSLSLGVALGGTGAGMLALDGREHQPSCSDDLLDVNGACPNVWTTKGPGIGMLAGGVALIGTGVALLVISKKRQGGNERAQARVGAGPGTILLTGRF
jgi:hypothetical protein